MKFSDKSANSQFSAGTSFYANEEARFVSQNVRDIGSQLELKMSRTTKLPTRSREGFAFEYLDAMDRQIEIGGKYKVEVPNLNTKSSPDIQIKSRMSDKIVQEQQLKLNSRRADLAANRRTYGKQEIRTPKGQTQRPKNPQVRESNVSTSEVSKGAKNPHNTARTYQLKAAISEIRHAATTGAIVGAVAATLISGLEHFLAVSRGEIEIDRATATVFIDALEGATIGGVSSGAFAVIPAFIPAIVPILNVISTPLLVSGAFQLAERVGQILDRHAFEKRNAFLEKVHRQDAQFFERFDDRVMEYLDT